MKTFPRSLVLGALIAMYGCNQGSNTPSNVKTTTAPTVQPVGPSGIPPSATASEIKGQIATGALIANAKVRLYDFTGKLCGETTSDEKGTFSLVPGACTGPAVLAAERSQDTGMQLYSLVTANEMKRNEAITRTLTPLSSVISLLVLGDHPQNVVYGKQVGNASRVTKANIDAAIEKLKTVIAPVLNATDAGGADLLEGPLTLGKGLDSALDMLDVYLNVDPDIKDYSVSFWMPTLHRPLMLRNVNAGMPSSAYIDPSNGLQPSDVKPEQVVKTNSSLPSIEAFVNQLQQGLNDERKLNELVDSCYMDSGNSRMAGSINMLRWKNEGTVTLTNLKVQRFNIYSDFDDEDHELNNTSGISDLAQISVDMNAGSKTYRWFTWLVRGSHTSQGCQSSGDGWRLYGNRSRIFADISSYALYRTEVSSAFAGRKDSVNSGLEYGVLDSPNMPISHVQIAGPGLPSAGILLVKSPTSGAFLTFNGTLTSLRNLDPKTDIETLLSRYASTALNDNAITGTNSGLLGIADSLDDRRNTYTFRVYLNRSDFAPSFIYKRVLHKRPHLGKEIPSTSFPILGFDNEQLLQSLTTIKNTKLEWSTPNDVWGQPIQAESAWYSRFGTEDVYSPAGVKIGTRKYKEFSAADSHRNLWHATATNTMLGTSALPRGKLEEASLQFRAFDSNNRSISVEYTFNLAR